MLLRTRTGSRPSFAHVGLVAVVAGVLVYSAVQLVLMPLLPVSAQGYAQSGPAAGQQVPPPPLTSGTPPAGTQSETQNSRSASVIPGSSTSVTSTSSNGAQHTVVINANSNLPPGTTVRSVPVVRGSLQSGIDVPILSAVNTEIVTQSQQEAGGVLAGGVQQELTLLTPDFLGADSPFVLWNQAVDLKDLVPALWNGSRWIVIPGATKTRGANGSISINFRAPAGLVAVLQARAKAASPAPAPGGFVIGASGTNQADKLVAAQSFPVSVIFAGADFERRHIVGGPAYVQTMTEDNLQLDDAVIIVRKP